MKKIIKKYGNSATITFSSEDLKIMKKKVGDIIEVDIRPKIHRSFTGDIVVLEDVPKKEALEEVEKLLKKERASARLKKQVEEMDKENKK